MAIREASKITPATLKALRAGSQQAFEAVYMRYMPSVKSFLTALVRSDAGGMELTQDVFVTLWERRLNIDPHNNISGYLYTIARNHAFKFLGRLKNTAMTELPAADQTGEMFAPPDQEIMANELELLVELVVSRMPTQRRRIFELSRRDGLSNQQIADLLGISKNTVENHITSALKGLREALRAVTPMILL